MNKKALTPIVSFVLLLLLAIALGTAVMSWKGSSYVPEENQVVESALCDPLNELKIKYVNGDITEQEYLHKKQLIEER
ncbi:MAG TPA: SHOCT domain-containing protein [Candidatus Nanoarchaeia archaeon]|nr:SHOCT domain-containing protein [Candidatus Nanoarchaeia archaeon]